MPRLGDFQFETCFRKLAHGVSTYEGLVLIFVLDSLQDRDAGIGSRGRLRRSRIQAALLTGWLHPAVSSYGAMQLGQRLVNKTMITFNFNQWRFLCHYG